MKNYNLNSLVLDKEVEIWMVRHGETIFNKKNIVQGWCDSPLTENGVLMTACLGKGFKEAGLKFESVYSSDLTRCIDTTKLILRFMDLSLHICTDMRLREINTGDGEGDCIKSHLNKYPFSLNFKKHTGTPNGEDWNDVFKRLIPAINEICVRHNDKNCKVLVVSHSMVIAGIMGHLDGTQEEVVPIPNNSVTVFKYSNGILSLNKYADTTYIEKGLNFSDEIKDLLKTG